jgi:hypothetical protein
MFKVTIETEYQKCTIELPENNVVLSEALEAIEQALYGVSFRFSGVLEFIEEA